MKRKIGQDYEELKIVIGAIVLYVGIAILVISIRAWGLV
jgi:hypothetical protein